MDALQFDLKKKQVSLTKTEMPTAVESRDVVVKVKYAGVCGTDLHLMDGKFPCADWPFILGHELCGVVHSVGSKVKHVKQGDRVAVDPNSGCGTCVYCTTGRYHLCPTGGLASYIGFYKDGGWAQYCKAPAGQIYRLPESTTFQQGLLTEPMSCISHTWDMMTPVPIGSSVLVLGAGIIGNLVSALLHHSGHRKVVVCEPSPARQTLNKKLDTGFKCCSPEELKAMKDSNPQWGVDLCVDCSGSCHAMEEAMSLLNPCGRLYIFGVASPEAKIRISPFDMFLKELSIVGSALNPYSFQNAINLINAMGSRYMEFEKLGVQLFSPEKHEEAFDSLRKGKISKAVFNFSSELD
ncbi:D-arabinitol dehydrogenase 1-like isoform X3 [Homalodisca vitripennis]|nr:D-arabinitol dehydrogenase 1-like isoform X3 [Homalodisca vitripennis]XP_046683528.1 D-arabinitol dehydrogenase 1-like isoform X3 [Homalodisca vitripennis]XP_046683533.1 D-arabinitol dehydrogenase 1-like isoform X3 [Homalodisca vitripennis]